MELTVLPYTPIENQEFFTELVWNIKATDVFNIQPIDDRILYPFINCKFKKITVSNSEEIEFPDISIYFNNCYIEEIRIEEILTKNISVNFGNTIVSGQIKNKSINSVNFNNCILRGNFFLVDIPRINISYTEENIYVRSWRKLIDSLKTTFTGLLEQSQKFYIYGNPTFNFRMNEIKRNKRGFYYDEYDNNHELKYCMTQGEKSKLNISLYFNFEKSLDSISINIKDSYLSSLSFVKNAKGDINVENTKVDTIYIHDFALAGIATFYNISPFHKNLGDLKIELHKSILKGFTFERVMFRLYGVVSFYRTDFEGTKFFTCDFPRKAAGFEKFKSLNNVHYPNLLSENYYKDQYEIFIQLKSILEKIGNFYEAQKLNAISNEALRKTNDIDWWDKRILWINSWSNYHGLSIAKPLCWLLLISILLYVFYLYSIDRIFNTNVVDWNLLGYYFSFIDITHRSDFLVEKKEFNAAMLTIDFLNKIVVGFFIYQFIASFRKYGKK